VVRVTLELHEMGGGGGKKVKGMCIARTCGSSLDGPSSLHRQHEQEGHSFHCHAMRSLHLRVVGVHRWVKVEHELGVEEHLPELGLMELCC
jgi:hypothetical protein